MEVCGWMGVFPQQPCLQGQLGGAHDCTRVNVLLQIDGELYAQNPAAGYSFCLSHFPLSLSTRQLAKVRPLFSTT